MTSSIKEVVMTGIEPYPVHKDAEMVGLGAAAGVIHGRKKMFDNSI